MLGCEGCVFMGLFVRLFVRKIVIINDMRSMTKVMVMLSAMIVVLFASCNRTSMYTSSEKTGWQYNRPGEGFFEVNTEYHGKCPNGMVYIPTATSVRGQNAEMLSAPENNAKKRVAANGFYMDEYEVTNLNWREYEDWMKVVWKHDPARIVRVLPDETVWRRELAYNEPYVENYYTHVAYSFYPVVGVSWEQATAYCDWRTDRINEAELMSRSIIPYKPLELCNVQIREHDPDSAFMYVFTTKNARAYVAYTNSPAFEEEIEDLLSRAQEIAQEEANHFGYEDVEIPELDFDWEANIAYDTNGDDVVDPDEWTVALDGALYDAFVRLPTEMEWEYAAYGVETVDGIYQQLNTYPWKGDQLRSLDDKKTRGEFYANFMRGRGDPIGIQINNTLTVPVNFFLPNGYGLYNMAGNVNEWVKDVYRAATANEEEVNSYRGNEFESDSAYAEDMLSKHFSYLSKVDRDSMRKVLINERGIMKNGGDFRDFKDGDKPSSLQDSVLVYRDATPLEQANMITNTRRVYKGGGWRDRPMWLNPGNRRSLEQKRSSNDIGFRCVMSAVGGNEHDRELYHD